jgi:hypothetical protein
MVTQCVCACMCVCVCVCVREREKSWLVTVHFLITIVSNSQDKKPLYYNKSITHTLQIHLLNSRYIIYHQTAELIRFLMLM